MLNKREVRSSLKQEQNNRCFYCNAVLKRGSHIDHIIPRCHGGPNNIKNLCLTCPRCNTYKSGFSLHAWLKKLEEIDDRWRYVHWKRWHNQHRLNAIKKLVILTEKDVAIVNQKVVIVKPPKPSTIHKLVGGLSGAVDSTNK